SATGAPSLRRPREDYRQAVSLPGDGQWPVQIARRQESRCAAGHEERELPTRPEDAGGGRTEARGPGASTDSARDDGGTEAAVGCLGRISVALRPTHSPAPCSSAWAIAASCDHSRVDVLTLWSAMSCLLRRQPYPPFPRNPPGYLGNSPDTQCASLAPRCPVRCHAPAGKPRCKPLAAVWGGCGHWCRHWY